MAQRNSSAKAASSSSSSKRPRQSAQRRSRVADSDDNDDDDDDDASDEEEQKDQQRRQPGSRPSRGGPSSAADAPAAPAAPAARPTAIHQALLRYITTHGYATKSDVQRFFDDAKRHCADAASKVLPLEAARLDLNNSIMFMEFEIRQHPSEVDNQTYWVLVDKTERVAAANAEMAHAGDDGEGMSSSSAAAAPTSSKKVMTPADTALFLNPSIFTPMQSSYFKVLLDYLISSPSGCITPPSAWDLRTSVAADRKHQLNDLDARHTISALVHHGWLRMNTNDKRERTHTICLGERTHVELKAYLEEKTKGERNCEACKHMAILCLPCPLQSSSSAAAMARCPLRLHYACADRIFKGKQAACSRCNNPWDLYAKHVQPDAEAK